MVETQSPSSRLGTNAKTRVLIVDDEPGIVKMMAEILRPEGYSCLGCHSGHEALRLMKTQRFDVVLCDVHMPEMGGLELLRFVRGKQPRSAFARQFGCVAVC